VSMFKVYKKPDLNGLRSQDLGLGDLDEFVNHNVTRIYYKK
ncbi:uncharacterized protein METZ01_LOCUS470266, partial [marine metagenome]